MTTTTRRLVDINSFTHQEYLEKMMQAQRKRNKRLGVKEYMFTVNDMNEGTLLKAPSAFLLGYSEEETMEKFIRIMENFP